MTASTNVIAVADEMVRSFESFSIEQSAALLVDAYRNTIDWQEGDDEATAFEEMTATVAGKYGEFLNKASHGIADGQGQPIAQIVCSLIDSNPTILFVYTAGEHKKRGLAERLIRHAAFELERLGHPIVSLYVTEANPAMRLYERLGFVADSSTV